MKNIFLLSVSALALASCAPMMATSANTTTPYTLQPQQSATTAVATGTDGMTMAGGTGPAITPVGTISVTNAAATSSAAATTSTTAKLTGLKPSTYYVAHYHLQGGASPDACRSGGDPIKSSMLVGMSDASGALTLSGSVPTTDIANATYFNVHTASDSMGTPADGGISCTPVKI